MREVLRAKGHAPPSATKPRSLRSTVLLWLLAAFLCAVLYILVRR